MGEILEQWIIEGRLRDILVVLADLDVRPWIGILLVIVIFRTRSWWYGTLLAPVFWALEGSLWAGRALLWLAGKIRLAVILATGLASGLLAMIVRFAVETQMPAEEATSLALIIWIGGWLALFSLYLLGTARSTRGSW